MAVGNIPSNVVNVLNRIADALLSLAPINFRFGDAVSPSFVPNNVDQQQGMEAANAVMLVSPLAEIGTTAGVEAVGTATRVDAGVAAATGETGTIYKLLAQEVSGKRRCPIFTPTSRNPSIPPSP